MNKKLHILFAGEEGRIRPFVVSRWILTYSLISLGIIFITATISGVFYFSKNHILHTRIAHLESNLDQTLSENEQLHGRIAILEHTLEEPLKDAVTELSERSKIIENILATVGIDIPVKEDPKHSGGPFTQLPEVSFEDFVIYEELLHKVDRYLETIQPVPLGFPVSGVITSKFGKRLDPFNKKPAFHSGIDIMNRTGTEIRATADGRVMRQGYDSKYGRYVLIDHKNGFKTLFGHNKKVLVKNGEKIERGQVVSLLGNTGRSTGPHLHYELRYHNKAINPMKFLKVGNNVKTLAPKRTKTLKKQIS